MANKPPTTSPRTHLAAALLGASLAVSQLGLGLAGFSTSSRFSVPSLFTTETAYAESIEDIQNRITETTKKYDEATQKVNEINDRIEKNTAHTAELNKALPGLKTKAMESLRTLYKLRQDSAGLLDLLLQADNFNELITTLQYLTVINAKNNSSINELNSAIKELNNAKLELESDLDTAESEKKKLAQMREDALRARRVLEAQISAQLSAEAQERQAAIDQAKAALAQQQQQATTNQPSQNNNSSQQQTNPPSFQTDAGTQAPVEVPQTNNPGEVNWDMDRDTFINQWSGRIDAYMAGSPLAGYGRVFAEAAWENGVDPRFSPAISTIESGKGRYCFIPFNAWGWGRARWSNWDEAIRAHTRGLAVGYGGHLTWAGAQRYCPPNAAFWYSSVLAQMERI